MAQFLLDSNQIRNATQVGDDIVSRMSGQQGHMMQSFNHMFGNEGIYVMGGRPGTRDESDPFGVHRRYGTVNAVRFDNMLSASDSTYVDIQDPEMRGNVGKVMNNMSEQEEGQNAVSDALEQAVQICSTAEGDIASIINAVPTGSMQLAGNVATQFASVSGSSASAANNGESDIGVMNRPDFISSAGNASAMSDLNTVATNLSNVNTADLISTVNSVSGLASQLNSPDLTDDERKHIEEALQEAALKMQSVGTNLSGSESGNTLLTMATAILNGSDSEHLADHLNDVSAHISEVSLNNDIAALSTFASLAGSLNGGNNGEHSSNFADLTQQQIQDLAQHLNAANNNGHREDLSAEEKKKLEEMAEAFKEALGNHGYTPLEGTINDSVIGAFKISDEELKKTLDAMSAMVGALKADQAASEALDNISETYGTSDLSSTHGSWGDGTGTGNGTVADFATSNLSSTHGSWGDGTGSMGSSNPNFVQTENGAMSYMANPDANTNGNTNGNYVTDAYGNVFDISHPDEYGGVSLVSGPWMDNPAGITTGASSQVDFGAQGMQGMSSTQGSWGSGQSSQGSWNSNQFMNNDMSSTQGSWGSGQSSQGSWNSNQFMDNGMSSTQGSWGSGQSSYGQQMGGSQGGFYDPAADFYAQMGITPSSDIASQLSMGNTQGMNGQQNYNGGYNFADSGSSSYTSTQGSWGSANVGTSGAMAGGSMYTGETGGMLNSGGSTGGFVDPAYAYAEHMGYGSDWVSSLNDANIGSGANSMNVGTGDFTSTQGSWGSANVGVSSAMSGGSVYTGETGGVMGGNDSGFVDPAYQYAEHMGYGSDWVNNLSDAGVGASVDIGSSDFTSTQGSWGNNSAGANSSGSMDISNFTSTQGSWGNNSVGADSISGAAEIHDVSVGSYDNGSSNYVTDANGNVFDVSHPDEYGGVSLVSGPMVDGTSGNVFDGQGLGIGQHMQSGYSNSSVNPMGIQESMKMAGSSVFDVNSVNDGNSSSYDIGSKTIYRQSSVSSDNTEYFNNGTKF